MHPIFALGLWVMMCFMCVVEATEAYKDFKYGYVKTGIIEGALATVCAVYCVLYLTMK